jgi:hypothetical protein
MKEVHPVATDHRELPATRKRDVCAGERLCCLPFGSRGRTRTYNLPVNSRTLCQLSYAGSSASTRP